jgi:hypothetical protein
MSAHPMTLRDHADIEHEPEYVAPPVDPLASIREGITRHMPAPYREMAIRWAEAAHIKGKIDALESVCERRAAQS